MIAVHARYRGREKARATVVERSAEALSGLPGVAGFEVLGVEDIRSVSYTHLTLPTNREV